MTYKVLKELIISDAYRYNGKISFLEILKLYLKTPGFNYTVKMRLTKYFSKGKLKKLIFPFAYFFYKRAMYKYGIIIPYKTQIGYGFYIGHFGGIVINSNVIIGNNVNISHGVTIGQAGGKSKKESPIIKNNIYIGPNSTIIGGIIIENNSAIGANALVNKSTLEYVTVGGVPAKKISNRGSIDYIHNIWKIKGEGNE